MRECVVFLSCRVTPHDIFMFRRLKGTAGEDRDVMWYCNGKPCDTHGEAVRFFNASEVKDLGIALYSDRDDGFTTYKLRGSEYGVLYLCRKDHAGKYPPVGEKKPGSGKIPRGISRGEKACTESLVHYDEHSVEE